MSDQDLQQWIGRVEETEDVVSPMPLKLMAATLDRPGAGAPALVPPLWHWLYFLPAASMAEVGADGHPRRGGFLPPVPLPRRMWAGSRIAFHHPLQAGGRIQRQSVIVDVATKHGKSGPLVFVSVQHTVSDDAGVALVEEQNIVYRDATITEASPPFRPVPAGAQFSRTIRPDPVLLFRYSALTFNSHRIHYDYPYVTQEEGYPDLVVHGPLVATLLIEEVQRRFAGRRIGAFEFKAVSPLFANADFDIAGRIEGNTVHVWSQTPQGGLAMLAKADLID
jgi:3-methylfumaryl-CoA hydratase